MLYIVSGVMQNRNITISIKKKKKQKFIFIEVKRRDNITGKEGRNTQ